MPPPVLGQRIYKKLRGDLNDALASAHEWAGVMLREIQTLQEKGRADPTEILAVHTEIMIALNTASRANLDLLRQFATQEDQAEERAAKEEAVGFQLEELRLEIARLWDAVDRRADNEPVTEAGEPDPP